MFCEVPVSTEHVPGARPDQFKEFFGSLRTLRESLSKLFIQTTGKTLTSEFMLRVRSTWCFSWLV